MHPNRTLLILTLCASCFAGCSTGGDTGSPDFTVHTSHVSVGASTPLALSGWHLAFLASEATSGAGGTNFNVANGDPDMTDSIAVAVDMFNGVETVLNVAAQDLVWIGAELYIVTSEAADSKDWSGVNGTNDLVLLHWSATENAVTYIDTLSQQGTRKMIAVGTNLFYSAEDEPAGATMSNLRVISAAAPHTTTMVPTQDLVAELAPVILGADEGLIFLGLDETHGTPRNLNNDADGATPNDTAVLALLDGSDASGVIRNVGLALPGPSAPFRARKVAAHDWQVGFLVSESGQGTNLNDPALFDSTWQPSQCTTPDTDTSDDVLHFVLFGAWNANPVTAPPRNTGIVGHDKIAIANGFIATISRESDAGPCNLNGDTDVVANDDVVRFTQLVTGALTPILPLNTAANIHALADIPGGTHGLAELGNAFVISLDELKDDRDIDGDGFKTKQILGWLLPSNSPVAWDMTPSTTAHYAGASWMAEIADRSRLNVALEESVAGLSLNAAHVPPAPGEDADLLDSVPTFAFFSGGTTLSYPGVAIATDRTNSGMGIASGLGFFRVDEQDDGRDWNGDGDMTDKILYRVSFTQSVAVGVSVLNSIAGRPAVEFDTQAAPVAAAFIASEAMQGPAGTDLNGDGDANDLVVRWFGFL